MSDDERAAMERRLRAAIGRVGVLPFAERRALLTVDGSPACAVLTMRRSTTFPGRLKVALVAPLAGGDGAFIPLTSEYRVESN